MIDDAINRLQKHATKYSHAGMSHDIRTVLAEIERLRTEVDKLGDHPAVLHEGGTSHVDRALRVINKQQRTIKQLQAVVGKAQLWMVASGLSKHPLTIEMAKAAEAKGGE